MSIFGLHQIGEERGSLEMFLLNANQKMRDFGHCALPRYRCFLYSATTVFYIPVRWYVGLKLMMIIHVQRLGCGG